MRGWLDRRYGPLAITLFRGEWEEKKQDGFVSYPRVRFLLTKKGQKPYSVGVTVFLEKMIHYESKSR